MHPWKSFSNNNLMPQNTRNAEPFTHRFSNVLPNRIIPQKPASQILNKMANRAYKRYDKKSRASPTSTRIPPSFTFTTESTTANPEVLFFPGNRAVESCCFYQVHISTFVNKRNKPLFYRVNIYQA